MTGRMRTRLVAARSEPERGSMALYLAVFAVAMLAMAGLVIDGGAALAARGQATSVAQAAARAGADAISAGSLRSGSGPNVRVEAAQARAAAQQVLDTAGLAGTVRVSGNSVAVTAYGTRRTVVLSAVGVASVGGSATATAVPIFGTTTGGG